MRTVGSNDTSAASIPSTLVPEIRPRKSPPAVAAGPDGSEGVAFATVSARRQLDAFDDLQLRHRRRGSGAERDELGADQRFGLGHRHGQRIAVDAVDAEFVMQMRAA